MMTTANHFRHWRRLGAALGCIAAFCLPAAPAHAQKVYVGVADQWNDLLTHPDQWQYVRKHADGFYVNFIEMDWVLKNQNTMSQDKLNQTAALFSHKNAYYESDMNETVANEQASLTNLQTAGFTVPLTSLNYGWSAPRAANLKTFGLEPGEAPRLNFVQDGPWTIGGDILSDADPHPVFTNAQYRAWTAQCDGCSTDGPLGLWYNDVGQMRSGSISMVKFAHSLHKTAMVMLCPYGANQQGYDPGTLFLKTAQDCVRQHEDAGEIPDIWAVFEYATSIAAVPDQVDGKPFNSTTGAAYWLLQHIHDPDRQARLDPVPAARQSPTARTLTYNLSNHSDWLDLCPVIRVKLRDPAHKWAMRCTLDGQDVTPEMAAGGLVFTGSRRLMPQAKHTLQVTLTSAKRSRKPAYVSVELLPNPSPDAPVHQWIVTSLAS